MVFTDLFKKIVFTVFGVAVLICSYSCEASYELGQSVASLNTIVQESNVERLVQKIKSGDVDAYYELAECYRDGNGVPQSQFNMFSVYMLASDLTGEKESEIIERLDENCTIRLFAEMFKSPNLNLVSEETVAKLRSVSPTDAMAYDAICSIELQHDTLTALQQLQEAESLGSEVASVLLMYFYEEIGHYDDYEQQLKKCAKRFPVLNNTLGKLYYRKSLRLMEYAEHTSQSLALCRDALEYFQTADRYGMLTHSGGQRMEYLQKLLGV